ncbi:hypothetical protein EJB05_48519, partial [Eragrostis curvula]
MKTATLNGWIRNTVMMISVTNLNITVSNLIDDSSAEDVKKGYDIQGIPWLGPSRDLNRWERLEYYVNVEDVAHSGRDSEKALQESTPTEKGQVYYEFEYNTRAVKPIISHFQLRNLVWATTKHDVYLIGDYSALHWSSLTLEKREVIDLLGHVTPSEVHEGSLSKGFFKPEVCSLAVRDNLLVAGGFNGEIICKIFENPSGSVHFLASNIDRQVRDFDVETFKICNNLHFPWIVHPWIVHHTSLSPDGKLAVVVGDSTNGLLVDACSGQRLHELRDHLDYSFASAWNPDGQTFATGNQDMTCRVWDVRNLSQSVVTLRGNIGAIRTIRYTSDGKFMAMAESADFVHIFDVASGFRRRQELDFFGEVAGMSSARTPRRFMLASTTRRSAASSSSIGGGSTRTLMQSFERSL